LRAGADLVGELPGPPALGYKAFLSSQRVPSPVKLVTIPRSKGSHLSFRVKRPGERRSASRTATRALDVLEAFGEARRPLRAVEIARLLDLTPSSANQLLKTMVESAHLVFDARSKCYFPSPRLAAFGLWLGETYGAGGRIRELVREVQERTGMIATVTTQNDLFMQIIDLAAPGEIVAQRGMQVSLFGSAIGSAWLATRDDGEIHRLADRARIPASEVPAILATVESIRQSGFSDGPTSESNLWAIAMPLPVQGGDLQTVLGLSGPAGRLRDRTQHHVAVMRAAIARWAAGCG